VGVFTPPATHRSPGNGEGRGGLSGPLRCWRSRCRIQLHHPGPVSWLQAALEAGISPNCSKLLQISTNFYKFLQFSPNVYKFLQFSPNFSKFLQIAPNFSKFLQISTIFSKFLQISPNFSKFFYISLNFSKSKFSRHFSKSTFLPSGPG